MMGAARAGFYKKRASSNAIHCQNPSSTSSLCTKTKTSKEKTCSNSTGSLNHLNVPNPALRRRSGSAPAIKFVTLATTWNLKHEHVRALKMTWSRLCEPPRSNCKGIVSLVERVWEKMDSKDKDVRNIFYNAAFVDSMHERCERRRSGSIATLRDHTHFFVSLISQVINNLEVDPTKILEHLEHVGQSHCYLKRYGFKSKHWEKVGEYFVDIVVIQDCVRGFPEACRAWTILISSIIDRMRSARRASFADSLSQLSIDSCSKSTSSTPDLRRGSILLPATTVPLKSEIIK